MFNDTFPQYLAIGMTYNQFWRGDCVMVRFYRKAEQIRVERENTMLWLQGIYIYEALCDVSPVLHAFAKKNAKPIPYPTKPYDIQAVKSESEQAEQERKQFDKNKSIVEMWASKVNEQFKRREAAKHDD